VKGQAMRDYLELTKPRITALIVICAAVGYVFGGGSIHTATFVHALLGTALLASGTAALNQWYEAESDGKMRRTRMRPLPDGRVSAFDARMFGLLLSAAGLVLLGLLVNLPATALALTTLVVYLIVYTPMKRRSSLATLVGAVPGALPPLIGWAASHGGLSIGGGALFLIVFLWQIPHFMALAWMYRDDYRAAGFPMLPVVEPDGLRTGQQALLYAAALLPVSIGPTVVGIAGWTYFWLALVLGVGLLVLSARFARERTDRSARTLFFASIIYLPLIWAVMVLDH